MKKLFFSAIPICLVSFILFGISTAILGTKPTYAGNVSTSVDTVREASIIDDVIVESPLEYTLTEVRPQIELHTSGVNAYVVQSEDENIHLRVAPGGTKISVQATAHNDRMTIKICPPNVTFEDWSDFGNIIWSSDIFNLNSNVEAVIAFPKLIYDNLDVKHGSGTLMIDGLYATYNDFDIGSGKFEYSKSDQFTANQISLDIGSGNVVLNNAQTSYYNIDIGSGNLNINGLSGYGTIDMGSGNTAIAYSKLGSDDGERTLEMGSGNMTLYFPDDGGCELYPSVGSGNIRVSAYGIDKKLTLESDDECVTLGTGGAPYSIDMGSGNVKILNTSEYTAPVMFSGRPDLSNFAVIRDVEITGSAELISSSFTGAVIEGTADSSGETAVTGMPSDTPVPEMPAAPEAPDAPEAPAAPKPPQTNIVSSSSENTGERNTSAVSSVPTNYAAEY